MYPNAPVVLVALEVRHPPAEPLARSEIGAIKRALSDYTPIVRTSQMQTIEIVAGPDGGDQKLHTERFPKLANRQSTLTVSYRETAMVVEVSVYPGWDEFSKIVSAAVSARSSVSPVDGVERVGLRYVDEIRVPTSEDNTAPDWSKWMEKSVLGPLPKEDIGLPLSQWQGVALYGSQPGYAMIMRYGPQSGFAVNFTPELRRPNNVEGGPFFLVDIDSFWMPDNDIPELNQESVMTTCEDLHRPIRTLFEGLVTEKLRKEVFRK